MVPRPPIFLYLCCWCLVRVLSEETEAPQAEREESNWLLSLWDSLFQTEEFENELSGSGHTDITKDSVEDALNDEETNVSTNTSEETIMSSQNVTQVRIKHVCVPYEGCTPALNCSNTFLTNDSNLEGLVNQGHVVGVNSMQLQYLLENVTHANSCVIVMFYTVWCQHSIDFAPVYNKLGVVFPRIPVVAMDFGFHSPYV